ncbi:FAD-binding protein [Nocardioides sp.]|uniref:FAD-binding protein n=1 Tax=Nocardioides sp. TaxID=35761 RepID=UPI003516BD39
MSSTESTESRATQVPAALPLADVDATTAERVDVVVVGFGIAGGCAALEAARTGARVLLLERAATHGGTSAMSGGHFYLGGGTAVQQATGHDDTPQAMYDYLVATSKEPEHDKIRAYCDGSVEHFGWLEALGFEFERSYYPHKAVIQPGTEGLMFTGNEKMVAFKKIAAPAPRGHKVPVAGDTEGTKMVMDLLRDRLAEAGVEVRYETGATHLVVDGEGTEQRVVGVAWKSFDTTGVVLAPAVVIAAGGFVMNREMVAAYTPALAEKPFVLGSTYDDGLGIRLGQSVGAELKHMDEPFITAPFYPPSSLMFGFIVNKHGQRFVNEDGYHSRTSQFVMEQPDHAAYLIVDSNHVEYPKFPLVPLIDGFETIAELETALDLPAGSVAATLERYNAMAAAGEDTECGKAPEWLAPQDTGPWAVFDLTLGKAMYAGFTLGGIRTTVDGRAQRPDGSVIEGLYAAGACASNIAQDGKGYCSGTQLGEGSFFGRRAGRHAADLARTTTPA